MKVPILCYHSCNAGDSYATDDHIALAADLRAIYRLGFRVVPLDWVVEALLGEREPIAKAVALTCDDGVDLDWIDADHPTYGRRRSFANIIRDFVAETGERDPPVEMTSFVVASPTTRKELEVACLAGLDWWNDTWWRDAERERRDEDREPQLRSRASAGRPRRAARPAERRLQARRYVRRLRGAGGRRIRVHRRSDRAARRATSRIRTDRRRSTCATTYLPSAARRSACAPPSRSTMPTSTVESDRWYLPRFTHGASDTSTLEDLERILRESELEPQ